MSTHYKSPLRYPGGKTRAVATLLPYIPEDTDALVSPFFGGGSLELAWAERKPEGEVFGLDYFKPLACFWKYALTQADALADRVAKLHPMTRSDFYAYQKAHVVATPDLDMAAIYYALNRCSFSGATLSGGMSPGHPRFTPSSVERLRKFRAPNVTVLHGNVFKQLNPLLKRGKNVFVYMDPPYYDIGSYIYGNKGDAHRGFAHDAFHELCVRLRDNKIRFAVSYNDCEWTREKFSDFDTFTPKWVYGMGANKKSSELLIVNL